MQREEAENYLLKEKQNILHNLNKHKTLYAVSEQINLSRKGIRTRLRKYEKSDLVYFENRSWKLTAKGKIIVGVDEAGRLDD